MTIEFTITDSTVELLANIDTGDNTLSINDTLVPESDWVGSGTYTVDGISIQQISANTGNIYCQKIDDTHYKLVSKLPTSISASQVSYDNAVSGATALQVQAALDELFANKVDKVTGKQLTTEDFTTALLNKLNGIEANANNYSLPLAADGVRGGIQLGYTASGKNYPVALSNEKAYVNVPWENTTYSNATQSAAGLMSAADKKKLDSATSTIGNNTNLAQMAAVYQVNSSLSSKMTCSPTSLKALAFEWQYTGSMTAGTRYKLGTVQTVLGVPSGASINGIAMERLGDANNYDDKFGYSANNTSIWVTPGRALTNPSIRGVVFYQ